MLEFNNSIVILLGWHQETKRLYVQTMYVLLKAHRERMHDGIVSDLLIYIFSCTIDIEN